MPAPQVKDKVLVRLASTGKGKLHRTKSEEVREITDIYGLNRVKDHVGDTWLVKPHNKDGAKWMAVL